MLITLLVLPVAAFFLTPSAAVESVPVAAPAAQLFAQAAGGDAVRGCCVIKAEPIKCNYTNRGYCRVLATDNGLTYDFLEGTPCRNVSMCPESR